MNPVNENDKMFNTLRIKIAMDMEIADSGAIGHLLLPGTQVTNVKPRDKPLTINLTDGTQLQSTHTCEINVTWLPKAAWPILYQEWHIHR